MNVLPPAPTLLEPPPKPVPPVSFEILSQKLAQAKNSVKLLDQVYRECPKLFDQVSRTTKQMQDQLSSAAVSGSLPNSSYSSALLNSSGALYTIQKHLTKATQLAYQEIVEPLEIFRDHYEKNCARYAFEGKTVLKEAEESRKKVEMAKDGYFKTAAKLEKAQKELKTRSENGSDVESKTNEVLDLKYQMDLQLEAYQMAVDEHNKAIGGKQAGYNNIIDAMMHIEESRVVFAKNLLHKFGKLLEELVQQIAKAAADITKAGESISSQNDLTAFVDLEKETLKKAGGIGSVGYLFEVAKVSKYNFEVMLSYVDEEVNGKSTNTSITSVTSPAGKSGSAKVQDKDYFVEPNTEVALGMYKSFEQSLNLLKEGKGLTLDQKASTVEILHNPFGRQAFTEIIRKQYTGSSMFFENSDCFKALGEFFNYLLTAYVMEKDDNVDELIAVLNASKKIYTKTGMRRTYLYTLIAGHGIWQEADRWKKMIDVSISYKSNEIKAMAERRKQAQKARQAKEQTPSSLLGRFTGMLKSAGGAMISTLIKAGDDDGSTSEEDEKIIYNAVATVLGQYLPYFGYFHFNLDRAKKLLNEYREKFGLEVKKIHEMELELQSCQPIANSHILLADVKFDPQNTAMNATSESPQKARQRVKGQILRSLDKRKKEMKKYGKNGAKIFGISMATKYLIEKKDLKTVLLLGKTIYLTARKRVFKQLLLCPIDQAPIAISLPSRLSIWKQVLNINSMALDYEALKKKVLESHPVNKAIDEVIQLDVNRSFTTIKSINPTSLINILRTYAYYNTEVEYCQGMNFIVGFLYLLFQDEALTFKVLARVIENYGLQDMFIQDVPLLKKFFYQMDRLMFIHYTHLNDYLRSEGVNANFFTSAWLMTIFTYSLQYVKAEKPTEMLLTIWDAFLLTGWKAIFKTSLFILKELEEKLFDSKFDQIMMMLGEFPRGPLMQSTEIAIKLRGKLKEMKISRELMDALEIEYEKVMNEEKEGEKEKEKEKRQGYMKTIEGKRARAKSEEGKGEKKLGS